MPFRYRAPIQSKAVACVEPIDGAHRLGQRARADCCAGRAIHSIAAAIGEPARRRHAPPLFIRRIAGVAEPRESAAFDSPAAIEDELDGLGIEPMFLDEDPRGETRAVSSGPARRRLQDDRTGVELGVTKCTVAPGHFHAVLERLRWASRPGNAGSSDGWMLSTRIGKGVEEGRARAGA